MAADYASDIASLLAPVSAEQPSGSDMSFSAEFDAIQEARRSDDASLDQGEWITNLKEADWTKSLQLTTSLLRDQTKDLRIASWYTEASAKTLGIGGMARGFMLVAALMEQFWETLHPVPDSDGMEQRIGNLSWLITRCVQLSRELPLVKTNANTYGIQDLDSARAHQQALERNPDSDTQAHVTMQQFKAAQRATPRSFYEQEMEACTFCSGALGKLAEVADARLGLDGPSFTPLKSAVEAYADNLQRVARENGVMGTADAVVDTDEDSAEESASTPHAQDDTGQPRSGGPIRTRAQALQQLRQVAEFFRRTEPHSPVAYLADKAAGWGEMPLHVWLSTVLKDEGAIARFEDLLGFESGGESS